MKEIITSIKEKLRTVESMLDNLPDSQKADLTIKLNRINKDLRGVVLVQLAINK